MMAGSGNPSDSPTPAAAEVSDPWIGQTLGSYTIIERVGEGGMGIVYVARHDSLHRLAAIKFLPADFSKDGGYVELFLREARAAAHLQHPNVVTVHDAGCAGDAYYFIMEYVEGKNLGQMLRERGALPVPEALCYIRQAASALAYAHKKGIVHRDVKPENLMLTPEGVIKVGDLGLAKWVGDDDGILTQCEWVLGSPVYISPERLVDPRFIDPRVDIYSLGGTFYHLVTGKIPYQGSSPVIMAQHLSAPVPNPKESNPIVDNEVVAIIQKMMAKDIEQRYQTMEEVEKTLAEYEEKRKRAKQPTVGGQLVESKQAHAASPKKRSAKLRIVVTALFVLALGAAGFMFFKGSAGPTRPARSPVSPLNGRMLADFGSAASAPAPDRLGDASFLPNGGHFSQSVDAAAGAWKLDFDISPQGASARAWIKLPDIDTTNYKALSFRIKNSGNGTLQVPVELTIGPASRRHLVKGVGPDWKTVRIPIDSLGLPVRKPLTEFTVYLEREISDQRKAILLIDDLILTKD